MNIFARKKDPIIQLKTRSQPHFFHQLIRNKMSKRSFFDKKKSITTLTIALAIFLSACQPPPQEYKATHYVFGTLVEFTLRNSDPVIASAVVATIGQDFRAMHRDWHAWQPGMLTELNSQLKDGKPHQLDPFLLPLFEQSMLLTRQSKGLFDPAIGQLIELWGFHSDDKPSGPPPAEQKIADWVSRAPTMADLKLDGDQLQSRNPAVQFDFGGFAKGYAIEVAQERLQQAGVSDAIINAGGDLCVIGSHGERPWRVAIRDPIKFDVLAEIKLKDGECAMTSGNYERFREHNDRRYAHIIDPRTGWPVEHIISTTVIAPDGGTADAAATALTVAGPEQWLEIARSMRLTDVMLVDINGHIHVSRSLLDRLAWPAERPAEMTIIDL